jgi:hypothetical protein
MAPLVNVLPGGVVVTVRERTKPAPDWVGKRAKITIGIHASEGQEIHDDATFAEDGALEPGKALTVAELGAIHEFGLGVPQRSFIRGWFDESIERNRELLNSQLKLVVAGKLPLAQALERVALKCEADVKRRIRNRIPPPNAPATIAKKGSSVPLIASGQLRASIRGKAEVLG